MTDAARRLLEVLPLKEWRWMLWAIARARLPRDAGTAAAWELRQAGHLLMSSVGGGNWRAESLVVRRPRPGRGS